MQKIAKCRIDASWNNKDMMREFDKTKSKNVANIDKVKDSLYSRSTDAIFAKRRHSLQDTPDTRTPASWNIDEGKIESSFQIPYTKILLGAFIFFILALGFTFSKYRE